MSILGLTPSRLDDPAAAAAKYDHEISLVDHTRPDLVEPEPPTAQSSGSQTPITPASRQLSQRLTRNSLREDLAKRGLVRQKYAKYQEGRTTSTADNNESSTESIELNKKSRIRTQEQSDSEARISRTATRLERGKRRVRGILNAKKAKRQAKQQDAVVDVLYENQRGSFFFGIPLFSGKSLLNFDPAPWVNGRFRPSPVNITNAQVPDPSWAWAWPNWYVDMSHDVDEEGWEYSFSWKRGGAWHGTHPWFHSFVRRRRWLRMRVRKHAQSANFRHPDSKRMSDAHKLNADYFTIHPARNKSRDSSLAPSTHARSRSRSLLLYNHPSLDPDNDNDDDDEICDIPTLKSRLRRAAIDREKIAVVRNFLANGGDELYYLAEQIPSIMALFVFQSSRRQLLALLLRHHAAVCTRHHRGQRKGSGTLRTPQTPTAPNKPAEETDPETTARRLDDLDRALRAADRECRTLEYWSDIRDLAARGQAFDAGDVLEEEYGDDEDDEDDDTDGNGSPNGTRRQDKGKSKAL
ncbi:hypothetical protein K490DRAFT_70250 [Saccharata proteae CBS 121410]|uniref:Peroxin/Ferlin domain-containing protein n=1 Tax=Saccharata proteae CBS 121410 TaxID=1314787 RepID=A0A9P4I1N6_9PEZI|nr:hypothetical protein K490DRAFT_70250 [Saccharata proteae CBS 121410]